MNRSDFLKVLISTPFLGMGLNKLYSSDQYRQSNNRMPVLFIGHGSPMIALQENEFVQGFRNVSSEMETPKAIIVISAHWQTRGTQVTAMEHPPTIHDFGGFPQELYNVQYPAPGKPELAKKVKDSIHTAAVHLDDKWGLDHGAWTVIRHMYPDADVPVIQLSLDYGKSPKEHYELAKELNNLRNQGVLIVGSGNIVHNLGMVDWHKLNENFGYDWAIEANNKMKEWIMNGSHDQLMNFAKQGTAFNLSIPTPEHYLPLLYALALKEKNEEVSLFNDAQVGGSLSMTSIKIG